MRHPVVHLVEAMRIEVLDIAHHTAPNGDCQGKTDRPSIPRDRACATTSEHAALELPSALREGLASNSTVVNGDMENTL
jgi:hypothetical protein